MPTASSSRPRMLPASCDELLAVGPALVDHLLDLAEPLRVQGAEGQVLELPLERVDAQAVGERRVDLERLLGLLDLLLLGHVGQRAHVVEPVGQLHDQHPDVARHRDDQLAVVLGLVLLLAVEVDLRQLGDPVNEGRDLGSELALDVLDRGVGVLDRVVQQRRHDGRAVQAEPRADQRAPQRVGDEGLPGVAQLVAVALLGERVGPPEGIAVDLRMALGDLRDELVELGAAGAELESEVRDRPSP